MFKYGRTDVIRVTTVDSLNFVQAMQDPAKQVGGVDKAWSFTLNCSFTDMELFQTALREGAAAPEGYPDS